MICWFAGSRLKILSHASASRASAAAPDSLVMRDRLEVVPLLPQPNRDRRPLVPQRANPRQRILHAPHQLIVSRDRLVKQFPPPRRRHLPVPQLEVHPVEDVNVPSAQHRLHLIEREPKQSLPVANASHPAYIARPVHPLAPLRPAGRLQQPKLLPVPQRPGRHPGQLGHLANAPEHRRRLRRRPLHRQHPIASGSFPSQPSASERPAESNPSASEASGASSGATGGTEASTATATSRSSAPPALPSATAASEAEATFPPRVHDTAAATSEATIAKSNVARSPPLSGAGSSVGKKLRSVSVACWAADK